MSSYVEELLGKWLADESVLVVYLASFVTLLFCAGAFALWMLGFDRTEQMKKRAWIITLFSAVSCFLTSLYACNEPPVGWDFRLSPALMGETNLTRFVVHFFRVQAVLDLGLGVLFYRPELKLLTSVVHHIAYTLLCTWMLANRCSLMFIICCLEELPTGILALGRINKAWRMDMPFGVTYGALRVALHTFLCYTVFAYSEKDDRLPTMRFNFGLTWILHTHWFYGWVRQQRRIAEEKGRSKELASAEEMQGLTTVGDSQGANPAAGSRSSSRSSNGSQPQQRTTRASPKL